MGHLLQSLAQVGLSVNCAALVMMHRHGLQFSASVAMSLPQCSPSCTLTTVVLRSHVNFPSRHELRISLSSPGCVSEQGDRAGAAKRRIWMRK